MAPLLKCLPLTAVLMILAIPANSEPLEEAEFRVMIVKDGIKVKEWKLGTETRSPLQTHSIH
jgi:hypothetical protein